MDIIEGSSPLPAGDRSPQAVPAERWVSARTAESRAVKGELRSRSQPLRRSQTMGQEQQDEGGGQKQGKGAGARS